jgi:hypothetical protein
MMCNKTGIDIFEDAGWDENKIIDVTIVQHNNILYWKHVCHPGSA